MATVEGYCDPAFGAVRETFAAGFAEGRELGAAIAVYADGRLVVDLYGGIADKRSGRAWAPDTPAFGFSCTKAVTATAALLAAERGAVDLDAPVTGWWPEYGAHGKDGTTAAHFLTHQAGLPAFTEPVTAQDVADPAAASALLAAQTPEWEPGTAHGYHALTHGWLAGEIVRRNTGRTVGEFVRQEFAGGLDLWIGAPDAVIERAARLSAGRGATNEPGAGTLPVDDATLGGLVAAFTDPASALNRSLNVPSPGKGGYNNPVVLRAGWPSAGMLTTAAAFGAFYRDLIAGRILRPETLAEAVRAHVRGPDRTLLAHSAFGLGYMLPAEVFHMPEAARATAFGHAGAGGSLGLGDPAAGLALAYLPNLMGEQLTGDLRSYRLTEAAYASL
ncbi:serine hydrolase domain-containing protein [Actinomadura flavalba]|uniref:serine hydrolase domain-containing protein n=1 Tax=Actinomadura flavalba TaxID=1120938 RepID=UPI0003795507|nr:serine hydrolase domain-containing protein [Actinomadura flavalba]